LTQAVRKMRMSLRAGGSEVFMELRIGLWPSRSKGQGLVEDAPSPSGQAESSPDSGIVIDENHCGFLRDSIFVQGGIALDEPFGFNFHRELGLEADESLEVISDASGGFARDSLRSNAWNS